MTIRAPFVLFWLLEFLICMLAVIMAVTVRFVGDAATISEQFDSPLLSTTAFGAIMTFSLVSFGLYQSHFRGGALGVLLRIALGFVAGGVALALFYYIVPSAYLGRGVTAIAMTISFFVIGTLRPLYLPIVERKNLKRRVAVLGCGEDAATIDRRLKRRADRRGFEIIHYLNIEGASSVLVERDNVITPPPSLLHYCRQHGVHELVLALNDQRENLPSDQLIECRLAGIDVIELISFFEREAGFLPLNLVRPSWFIYAGGFQSGRAWDAAKRAVDLLASGVLLLISLPVMVLTGIAILIESGPRAPIFYRQERVGFGGQLIDVLKFRSMRVDAEAAGQAIWASAQDDRVTRVGRVIRALRIDELPQILNVFKGDMSLVGPRPERPAFVEELKQTIPYYAERHQVKPGVTGWAQVSYPYGASIDDARCKHEFDLYYVKNRSLFLDLFILLQTVEVVLLGKGAR
ncbi:MAG: TIGR03013 family XrtA/PEP-CTERM system glycosyltransferase [Pseudomonadota bacterium]